MDGVADYDADRRPVDARVDGCELRLLCNGQQYHGDTSSVCLEATTVIHMGSSHTVTAAKKEATAEPQAQDGPCRITL
jgi:hypothetical protein